MSARLALLLLAVAGVAGVARRADAQRRALTTPPPVPRVASLPDGEVRLLVAVLDTLVAQAGDRAVVCVSVRSDAGGPYALPAAVVSRLRSPERVRSTARCPRTYTQMVTILDSAGRPISPPPGYVDPVYLAISRPMFESPRRAHYLVEGSQGTSGWIARCITDGPPLRVWCQRVEAWIS
jgi:hypothetical protein